MTEVAQTAARELLAIVEEQRPGVVRLATLVSLAVRIEPGLLRRARLSLAPDLPAGVEAEFWFSPIVASRSTSAIVLDEDVAVELRQRLLEASDRKLSRRARALVEWAHGGDAPPTIQLEEEIIWSALTGADEATLTGLLARAVTTMTDDPGRRRGIARWAARALPTLHPDARESAGGRLLMAGAQANLGLAVDWSPALVGPAELAVVLPEDAPRLDVGLRLLGRGIEVSEPPSPGSLIIAVPRTKPVLLRVRPVLDQGSNAIHEHIVVVVRGRVDRHAVGAGPFVNPSAYDIVLADGRVARLEPERPKRGDQPLAVTPQSLDELVELVRWAEHEGTTVHAIASGRGLSGQPTGYLIRFERLNGLLELDDGTLRTPSVPLVRVLGGTSVKDLNEALDRVGLALPTMGGDDQETIAGLVSTSGHGSGLAFGPFPDLVRSLDLVVSGGEVLRVEPADGPSDAERFASLYGDGRRLVQDDAVFWAAVCGIGAMGLIHSLVIEVRDAFWLNEVRTLTTWEGLREQLGRDGILYQSRHVEVLLNPYPREDGRHLVLVTRRDEIAPSPALPTSRGTRKVLREHPAARFVDWRLTAKFVPSVLARGIPNLLAWLVDDGFAAKSYQVFDVGASKTFPDYSSELVVAMEDDRHLKAVDDVLEIAEQLRRQDRMVHTAPLQLQFTGPSHAYASMMYGSEAMTIEFPLIEGTRNGYALLAEYERRLAGLGVRPHWGHYNLVRDADALYPRWNDWLRVLGHLNASGVFDSPLTERIGARQMRRS